MKVIIEVEKNEDIKKIKKALKGETINVVRVRRDKNKVLEAIFRKYNVKLPKDYVFDREAIHAR